LKEDAKEERLKQEQVSERLKQVRQEETRIMVLNQGERR
jgi:hypothetical protein